MKNQFSSLNNNEADAHCVNNSEKSAQGVTTPCYSDFASNFEIISCNKNYDFNHNNFYRNGNNHSTTEVIHNKFKYWIASLLSVARNDDSVDCHARQVARARCVSFGDDKLISHYEALAEVIQSVMDCFARQRRAFSPARNDDSVDCHARTLCAPFGDDKLISHYEALAEVIQSVTDCFARQRRAFSPARNDGLFSRNDYGKDFIFDFGNNFNYGFLFNRKIKKNFKARRKTQ